jgi:hypothetical protein
VIQHKVLRKASEVRCIMIKKVTGEVVEVLEVVCQFQNDSQVRKVERGCIRSRLVLCLSSVLVRVSVPPLLPLSLCLS